MLIDPIASGASVLQRKLAMESIKKQHKNLIGVEMEIFAVLTAAALASKPQPTAIGIKSVCDFGDEDKKDGYQKFAAYTSARYLKEFALRFLEPLRTELLVE